MARVKIRHYCTRQTAKGPRAYWVATRRMREAGFESVTLGADGPAAWVEAERLNAMWDRARAEEAIPAAPRHPVGSLGDVFERYRRSAEWARKARHTRYLWEHAWRDIAPVFADMPAGSITFEHCDAFYRRCREALTLDRAHKTFRTLRALLNVAVAMGAATHNPSAGVRNTAPRGRTEIWMPGEVSRLIAAADEMGYAGLALAIAIIYDSELQPADARALTPGKRRRDPEGDYFQIERAKTGKRAFATLSANTSTRLDAYLAGIGALVPADQPILRHRSGRAYTREKLCYDFRRVTAAAFPGDRRRLQDLRRSGNVEAALGGAMPQDLSHKAGNTIGQSNRLFETYTPTQLAGARRADAARARGRAALKGNE